MSLEDSRPSTTKSVQSKQITSRRNFIASSGAAVVATSLAGCSEGNQDDDEQEISFYTSAEDTAGYAMAQGFAQVINENSDLNVSALPSAGTAQSMQYLDNGEADMAYTTLTNAHDIVRERGSYKDNPFDVEIQQMFHWYDAGFNWAFPEDSGLEYVSDFNDKVISAHETGAALHNGMVKHLDLAAPDATIRNVSFTDEPSALQDGQIDAATDVRLNGAVVPGYNEQMYQQIDNLRISRWEDDIINEVRESDELSGSMYGTADAQPEGYYWGEEEIWWPEVVYVAFTTGDMDEAIVDEFMSTLWDNMEAAGEYHGLMNFWSDIEFWGGNLSSVIDVHPAAEDLFKEHGVDI